MAATLSLCPFTLPLLPPLNPSSLHPTSLRLTFARSPLRSLSSRAPRRSTAVVASVQSTLFKVIQTAWRIGRDGVEAGTNLVPDSVPRPAARISVAVVVGTVGLFLLKSVISTAFFVLAMMGFIYFLYIAFNKDEASRGGGGSSNSNGSPSSDEEALDEVKRIMEKYK